ncbi:uncharacterized protein LOC115770119 isoform X2 [Drosophila novamexicana]|uniref:uncharacterized protein LOC115770119 isoform X2 n=1 Tax=Drosophila novamexicana TaxID=47314 RepID=UPI0011E5900A|nr:uncharacterized protein LOC115770119 isoform X2 [Drosophila novamexicana]
MGVGLAAPPIPYANREQRATDAVAKAQSEQLGEWSNLKVAPMHEKILEDSRKEKTEKVQLLGHAKEKLSKEKPLKQQSRLAERLRRSFRRSAHSSLELKSTSDDYQSKSCASPSLSKLDNNNHGGRIPFSVASQLHLPGLALGGHINAALLLDSPDECTPPEYAYQHLSSVATTNTNSSSSLESNFELSELRSSQTNLHWAGSQQIFEMGSEMSTAATRSATPEQSVKRKDQLTSSSRNDQPPAGPPNASRSCSITSESSSVRITRLQNFLFRSSNESSRSCQGHSNDGFTASSFNSSSGEWEQLGAHVLSSSSGVGGLHDLNTGSFPEEDTPDEADGDTTLPIESGEAGAYYQYTLTSPNNPFLPEITARTYHSTYEDDELPIEGQIQPEELQLDCNVTSVKYTGWGTGSRSAQLPTPAYSRAGSQESTFSESGVSCPQGPTPSPASSSSSTPGRHRRKLFSLNSPTRLLHHQQSGTSASQQHIHNQAQKIVSPTESLNANVPVRNPLNPFLPATSAPIAVPGDLRSKREEFLRATMKICLVVSPPASKLQLKSKSLTHLDGLDTLVPCQHGAAAPTTATDTIASPGMSVPAATPGQQTQAGEIRQPPKVCQPSSQTMPTTCPPPTIYTQAPQLVRRSPSLMLSPGCSQASGIGSSVRCSVSSSQHPACSSASATSYLTPSTKNVQSNINDNFPTSPIGSATIIPHSYYGGSKTVTSTTMTSSLIHRKKPLLTRSEVSSSEFFSVSFCLDAMQCHDEEFIPATKGTTLQNALKQLLHRRNLSFSQIKITDNNPTFSYLDTGPTNLTGHLDENTDVENLAGHHLVITERDNSRKSLQKAASFGSRQRPPRLLSSASTEETSESGNATGKQILGRWSSIFGIKNPQQSQLYDLLNNYAKNGVPQRPDALNFEHPALADSLNYLHNMDKSWRDFVDSNAMSDSEIKIQTAIWELVTTEVYYIHALQTVTDLFLACLEAVQEERLLIDVDQHRLFSNVRSVCEANIKFWTMWLYPMVAHSIRTHEPLRCAFFQEGFISFASIFAPYKVYCAEQSTCQFYCKELNQNNALFTVYLAWCESQKMCNRLRLADIVVRPMQRLTKYSLLLAAIKKHMSDVEEIEVMDIMIHSVENFVGSVNNHLTMRQESERLKGVMARIESYDVVDTNNEVLDKLIKQHSQMFDLCAPMRGCPASHVRHLFMEGDHKFKDNVGKSDVHCFLLTDILLVCKSMAKKGLGALKVIRQPYLTDHLIVHLAHNNTLNCVYLNEFQVATTAFTLQCTEAKNWYDALWRAKTIYQRLKRGNGGDSFRFGGSGTTGDSLGVRKSPINSSIGSHVSSANNSHSGSVEWNDSRNISVEFEKTNSLSSDEGSSLMGNQGLASKGKQQLLRGVPKPKIGTIPSTSANTLSVQPVNHLGQSLPNLNLQHNQTNNTLLVPGTTTSHSGILLLSPSHRGISYPPPSPTRVPLKRGMAFSTSTKNPPLLKTRNITSQNSINWHQIPATPTPPSPRSQHSSPSNPNQACNVGLPGATDPRMLQKQISHQMPLQTAKQSNLDLQRHLSNETDV